MSSQQPTVKDIAAATGLSIATVSLALRRSPKIRTTTGDRVRAAAEKLGYTPSPLVAALMARIRGAAPVVDQTTIALINLSPTLDPKKWPLYYREVIDGVRARAARLGFSTEIFHLFERGMSPARLDTILLNRGIHGVIVPPFVGPSETLPLDLSRLCTVVIGNSITSPLHRTSPDQFQAMMLAMDRLSALGYHNIGLVLDAFTDRRVGHKWIAAHAWHEKKGFKCPQLTAETISGADVIRWIERQKLDALFSPRPEHLEAIRAAGIVVPKDLGFCLLNYADHVAPCTAIDQRPTELGAAAVDTLVAQLYRNERGIPAVPTTVSIEARWVDGPTTRDRRSDVKPTRRRAKR